MSQSDTNLDKELDELAEHLQLNPLQTMWLKDKAQALCERREAELLRKAESFSQEVPYYEGLVPRTIKVIRLDELKRLASLNKVEPPKPSKVTIKGNEWSRETSRPRPEDRPAPPPRVDKEGV